ncbi:MAG: porin family protein [Deltaproteobacteria bacterium]|nr:porin family protein [Deltaproteobacteria bacterium]
MKKSGLVLLIVGIMFCLACPAFADDKEGFYLGVGGSYALENFQTYGSNSYDDATGFNIKAGYKQSRASATEFSFDYFPEFKWTHPRDYLIPATGMVSEKIRVYSVMLAQKLSIPNDTFRPFLIGGIGYMSAESEHTPTLGSPDETGFCYKAGLGMDVFITSNISLGLEGSYFFGVGDVRYGNFTLGVAYHF